MKKKGFTLIELLAVIVILAIIALIATPLVLKYIEKSRQESFRVSTEGIKDAVNYYIVEKTTKGEALANPEIIDVQDLDLKNKSNLSGRVIIHKVEKDYIVSYDNITDGKYVLTGNSKEELMDVNSVKDSTNPMLITNDEKVVIDHYKNYVYGIDDINNVESKFEVINGELEYAKNSSGTYSTGAKLNVLKDGQIYKTYTIICFGDITGDAVIDVIDAAFVPRLKKDPNWTYDHFTADVNRNGVVDDDDRYLITQLTMKKATINQTTGKITLNQES